ncbi:MAG: SDR family oxidoreductase [Planctomycetota bacterium]
MQVDQQTLIIGAGGGIGQAISTRLARRGHALVLAGRTSESLSDAASAIGGETAVLDATDFDAVDAIFDTHRGITGVVNLAGSILLRPAHMTSAADFDDTINQNLRTAFAVVRSAGRHMRSTGGSVVLMSTCAAQIGLPNHEAIAAAKAGIDGLVRSAAATYASSGLRFNAIAPGLVDTPLAARIVGNEAALKASMSMHPLGRIGTPDDIAQAIEFLLAPSSSWMTGQIIGVDGGLATIKS